MARPWGKTVIVFALTVDDCDVTFKRSERKKSQLQILI